MFDYYFLFLLPAVLGLACFFLRERPKIYLALLAILALATVLISGDWKEFLEGPTARELGGSLLLYLSPFLGVIIAILAFRDALRSRPWLVLVVTPIAFWFSFATLGIGVGMMLGLVTP